MRTTIIATLAFAVSMTSVMAEPRYDRRLEAAAIRIVAAKMGDLRGAFGLDERPAFVVPMAEASSAQFSFRRAAGADATSRPLDAGTGTSRSF